MNEFENIKWNNQLQGFSNPMQNLFSLMRQCAMNMKGAEYVAVCKELEEANKLMVQALDHAQCITYSLPTEE